MLCRHITIGSAAKTVDVLRYHGDFERVTVHRRRSCALAVREVTPCASQNSWPTSDSVSDFVVWARTDLGVASADSTLVLPAFLGLGNGIIAGSAGKHSDATKAAMNARVNKPGVVFTLEDDLCNRTADSLK